MAVSVSGELTCGHSYHTPERRLRQAASGRRQAADGRRRRTADGGRRKTEEAQSNASPETVDISISTFTRSHPQRPAGLGTYEQN